jgi:hypothetical protein
MRMGGGWGLGYGGRRDPCQCHQMTHGEDGLKYAKKVSRIV